MLVAVILGNRMKDDGTMSDIMKQRLEMAIKINKLFAPSKIILSGGVANPKAGISEAQCMYDYLTAKGLDQDLLIKEDKSMTTLDNAKYSCPILKQLGATEVLVCTSTYHMERSFMNPIKVFKKYLRGTDIKINAYCE